MYTADDDIYESMQLLAEADQVGAYEELNDAIAEYEVKNAISDLKVWKAAGHDILINELYINAMDILTPKLVCLFNTVFQSVFFPTSRSEGIIIPIRKKGSRDKVDNHRGITLLSTLGKLFTRGLNNRLNFWSDTYSVLIDAQGWFRSGRSTVDSIFILHGLINNCLNNSKKLYCASVDFRKAFDYISRDCLWYKL